MKPSYLIILLVMNFFWAAVYSSYKMLDPVLASGGVVTLRFGLAGLCFLLAWPWLPGKAPSGRDLLVTCVMGLVLFVAGQRLQVYGNQIGSAGNSAVLMGLEPVLTAVAAALFLREHIGPRRLFGSALGLAGVFILHEVWRPEFRFTSLAASLIFISSFICEAGYSVLGKQIIQRASVMKMLALSLLTGTALNLLIDGRTTFHAASMLSPKSWALLLALSLLCTVIGYTVWFVVLKDCPVNVAALTVFAQAIFGTALAAFWLGEKLRWGHLAGSLTIALGLVIGLSRQIRTVPAKLSDSGLNAA